MSAEENKAVSNRIAEAIGAHDFDLMDELMSPAIAAGFKAELPEIYRAFPDYRGVNELQLADGDYVTNRFRYTGTHRGEFLGIAPTGKELVFEGITIDEIRDGRLVGVTIAIDQRPLAEQLGARLRAEVLVETSSPGR